MTYAEVSIDGDGDHNERREGNVWSDQELVQFTDGVDVHAEVDVLHEERVRNHHETRDEVDERHDDDAQGRHQLVLLLREDVQDQRITGRADHAKDAQDHHDDVQFRYVLVVIERDGDRGGVVGNDSGTLHGCRVISYARFSNVQSSRDFSETSCLSPNYGPH